MHLTALDTVGLAFSSLEFATSSRTEWSSEALNEWGDRLSSRVTYLMEPLKVLEIDARGARFSFAARARPPRDTERGYYEMRLFRQGMLAHGAVRVRRDDATARQSRASSRAKLERWPTTSSPAWAERRSQGPARQFVDHASARA